MTRNNKRNKKKNTWLSGRQLKKRSLTITLCFTILLTALCGRVAYIQFVKGAEYQQMAKEQQSKQKTITAKRGSIYDRNGVTLAMSATVYKVIINPRDIAADTNNIIDEKKVQEDKKKGKKTLAEHQVYVAKKLSEILALEYNEVFEKVMKTNAYQEIARKIDDITIEKLRKWKDTENIFGVYIEEDTIRNYPNNSLAAHIIGYTGAEDQGLTGVESVYNEYLKGENGYVLADVDANQNLLPLAEAITIEPENGNNIVLTIDEQIQYLVEKSLEKEVEIAKVSGGAACIVMAPKTGEILAMASYPSYDLNAPFSFPEGIDTALYNINKETWSGTTKAEVDILNKTVWRNKALSDAYEPGSTFKTITAAMLLEEKLVTRNTTVHDVPYQLDAWKDPINCWRQPNNHGTETFEEALYNSCNPVFAQYSVEKIGLEKFYNYMDAFDFYTNTGINFLGEGNSIIHAEPTLINMATASFGQRFVVTPLQMVSAYCAIANGGELLVPQLVKEITDESGNTIQKFEKEVKRKVLSTETCKDIMEMLEGVVSKGTGTDAYIKGYRIAGKTGTSETLSDEREIISFCGVAPADNPEIVCLYILDHPNVTGANTTAAAGKLMEEILNYMKVERIEDNSNINQLKKTAEIPMVQDKTVEEAKTALLGAGFNAVIIGEETQGAKIVKQVPESSSYVPEGSNIILYLKKDEVENVTVPDLKGKSVSEAFEELKKNNLCMKIYGSGTVKWQESLAGATVPAGTVITVEFRKSIDNSNNDPTE